MSDLPQEFRRVVFPGYTLNAEKDSFYYISLSRLHPQRIHANNGLSETSADPVAPRPCGAGAQVDESDTDHEVLDKLLSVFVSAPWPVIIRKHYQFLFDFLKISSLLQSFMFFIVETETE